MTLNTDDPIHFSEVSTYLRCNYLHHLNYNKRLVPRRTASQIAFGTLGHAAMKSLILGGTNEDAENAVLQELNEKFKNDLFLRETEECMSIGYTALEVAKRVFPRIKERFNYKNVMVEQSIKIEVDGILFQGTPDWVAEDSSGVWVIDHKFRKTFMPEMSEFLNLQMAFYQGLLDNAHNITTIGSRQLQIKPKLPLQPEILKNGKVSKKDTMTDWDTYAAFVKSCGQNPSDYIDEMKDKLDRHIWFDIDNTKAYRSIEEVSTCWNRIIIPAAKEIIKKRKEEEEPLRCMNWGTCRTCNMFDYCTESLKGGDLVFLEKTKYKNKDELDFVEVFVMEEE